MNQPSLFLPTYECRFSPCGLYRYRWSTTWDHKKGNCAFIGLNPSTADAQQTDPTIRRCIQYVTDWGFGTLTMLNLFAFRATDPKQMMKEADPVGPENDGYLVIECALAACIVAAWGAHGKYRGRGAAVRKLMAVYDQPLNYLHLTESGEPGHPLYLRRDLIPKRLVL